MQDVDYVLNIKMLNIKTLLLSNEYKHYNFLVKYLI